MVVDDKQRVAIIQFQVIGHGTVGCRLIPDTFFLEDGEAGLEDRRGKRKSDEEMSEVERLRRENLRLKWQLEEERMTVELLKKVKDFEGM